MPARALACALLFATVAGCGAEPAAEVRIFAPGKPAAAATAFVGQLGRDSIPPARLHVMGLQAGWRAELVLPTAAAAAAAADDAPPRSWAVRHPGRLALFLLAAFYAVFTIGVTGGPSHGEHPLIVSVIHLIAFLAWMRTWDEAAAYGLLLVASLVIAVLAMRHKLWEKPGTLWVLRLGMAATYAGMLAILLSEPEHALAARWASRDAIEIYVPRRLRGGSIELIDKGGRALTSDPGPKASGPDLRVLHVWMEPVEIQTVRAIAANGETADVRLRGRPAEGP
jgi:hypothetical protein